MAAITAGWAIPLEGFAEVDVPGALKEVSAGDFFPA
jgi:hypothetical protein